MGWAAIGATAFSVLAMGPMLQAPSTTLCAYDHPGDAMISIWSTWVRRQAHAGRWTLDHVPVVAAP